MKVSQESIWYDYLSKRTTSYFKTQLKKLVKRFSSNTDLLVVYNSIIKSQWDSGIIETVLEKVSGVGQVHYLLHHPVLKESKT